MIKNETKSNLPKIKFWVHESTPLDRPVTHITRPAKGAFDRTCTEEGTGDIGSNGCKPLNEDNEDENSLEHPLPLTTSTLPSPPIITATAIKWWPRFSLCSSFKTKVSAHYPIIENPQGIYITWNSEERKKKSPLWMNQKIKVD